MAADGTPNELKHTVGRALGRIPSGVFVLTARDGEQRIGMLASFVQQASFHPPAICLAVGKDRGIRDVILRTRRLGLSVLADGDHDLMRRFAKARPDVDAFEGLDVFDAPSGVPVLAHALAWLDGELLQAVDFDADHELFIARVAAGDLLREGRSFTHVRGNGFHY